MYWTNYLVFLACLFKICFSSTNLEGWFFSQLPKHVQLEKKQYEVLEKFANTLAQKHGMFFLLKGLGVLVDDKETRAGFSFVDHREMTIDQGRPIAVSMHYAFCDKFNNDPLFKTWLKHSYPGQFYSWAYGMKISFWDKNYDRPLAPKLSQIRVIGDKINYYYASAKDQSLELVHSESITDAIAIVTKPKDCEPDASCCGK